MKEAFLVGAGLSRAISDSMPLLRDLSAEVFPEDLRRTLTETLGPDFESQITYLAQDHPWMTAAEALRNRAQFLDSSKEIAKLLLRRQREALSQPIKLWLPRLISAWHERRVDVLTLNYDTLIEKAYMRMAMAVPHGGLRPDHHEIYAVPIPDVASRQGSWHYRDRVGGTFRLLKLHGSINWCYSGSSEFFGEVIYDLGLRVPSSQEITWSQEVAEDEDDLEHKAPDKVNLIVPPTSTKASFFNNETIRAQWRLAYEAVRSADRLYCLGCSLAKTDELLNSMLAFGLRGKTVVPVTTGAVAERYREVLPSTQIEPRYIGMPSAVQHFVEDWAPPL